MNRDDVRAAQAKAMTEDELTTQVLDIARAHGWVKELAFHAYDSRRSREGFPDWTMVNPRQRRLLFVELKKQNGTVTFKQQTWIDALALVGVEVHVWRPLDLLAGRVNAVLSPGGGAR